MPERRGHSTFDGTLSAHRFARGEDSHNYDRANPKNWIGGMTGTTNHPDLPANRILQACVDENVYNAFELQLFNGITH